MSGVEYAPRGLLGVLTPQANTTVEPEFTALLPPEARQPHEPTPDELARTYPGGKVPSNNDDAAEHEADRRPGTD